MVDRRARAPSPLLQAASSLIGDASARLVTAASRFRHSFEAPVARIAPDPAQPRKQFSEADIAGLAATMAEHGQLQPVLLRRPSPPSWTASGGKADSQKAESATINGAWVGEGEHWILVAGERRWRAARLNGWTSLLAIEVEGDAEVMMILENLQRVDLSPVEEARGLRRLIDIRRWTQDRAAAALGKSKAEISAVLRILTLPDDLLDRVLTSELALSRNALVELARADEATRKDLLARAGDVRVTVRDIRSAVAKEDSTQVSTMRATPRATEASFDVRTAPELKSRIPARDGGSIDPTLLEAAAIAIEAAMRDGVSLDLPTRQSLKRLQRSAALLLRTVRSDSREAHPPTANHRQPSRYIR